MRTTQYENMFYDETVGEFVLHTPSGCYILDDDGHPEPTPEMMLRFGVKVDCESRDYAHS